MAAVQTQIDNREATAFAAANAVNTQVAEANTTLDQVYPTLTAVHVNIAAGEARVEALRLVALAREHLDTNPILAALLGVQSLNIAYTAQADAVMYSAFSHEFPRLILQRRLGIANSAAYSPDGQFIVVANNNDTAVSQPIWILRRRC